MKRENVQKSGGEVCGEEKRKAKETTNIGIDRKKETECKLKKGEYRPREVNGATHTLTHTRLTALFRGLPRWAGTRKGKPIWILLKHETVSGSGISWAMCKSAPRSRQITMPAPHHSVFYRPDALPAAQPTASKH